MSDLRKMFAAELRKQRKRLSITQAELAEKLDLSVDMIGRLERGSVAPSFETVERLAKLLEIPPAILFGASEWPELKSAPRELRALVNRLKGLSPAELAWLDRIILAALSGRR